LDTKKRAWVKSITWRIFGILILGTLMYLITGNWKETGWVTIIFHGIRIVTYYWHERIWDKIKWGRIK